VYVHITAIYTSRSFLLWTLLKIDVTAELFMVCLIYKHFAMP